MTAQLLTATQLAERLGVHPVTVHRRVEHGKITPTAIVGNQPVWSFDAADGIAAAGGVDPAAPPAVGSLVRLGRGKRVWTVTEHTDGGLIAMQFAGEAGPVNTSIPVALAHRLVVVGHQPELAE